MQSSTNIAPALAEKPLKPAKPPKQVTTPENEAAYFAQATGIIIGPYLTPTHDMGTSLGVAWVTAEEGAGVVEFGLDRVAEHSVREETPVKEHFVLLTGLKPGTRYKYRVKTGALTSKEYSFRTSPPDGKCKILIGADWHFQPYLKKESYRLQLDCFALSYPDMLKAAPDVVLLQGDNCESALSAWYSMFETCRDLFASSVVILTQGNHEVNDKAVYPQFQKLLYFPSGNERDSFVYGRVHMTVLLPSPELAEACAATEHVTDWRILNWHWPLPYSHTGRSGPTALKLDLAEVLAKYPVDFALFGHRHQYERTHPVRINPHEPADWGILSSADASAYSNIRGATIWLQSASMWYGFTHAIPDLYHAPKQGVDYSDGDWQTFSVLDFDGRKCRFTTFGANRETKQSRVIDDFTIDNTPQARDKMPRFVGAPQARSTGYEAVISFKTDIPAKAIVRFGKEKGQHTLTASPEDVLPVWASEHDIQLNCLDPQTTYYYQAIAVRGDQQAVSGEGTFTTGPASPGMIVGKFDFGFVAYGAAAGAVKDAGHTLRDGSWFGWDQRAATACSLLGDNRSELGATISDEFAAELACMTRAGTWTVKLPNGRYNLQVTGGGNKTRPTPPYKIVVQDQATLFFDQPDQPQVLKAAVTVSNGALTLRLEADPADEEGVAKLNALTITASG